MRVTGVGQPVHLLLDVVDVLNGLQIPYAVVGALAVSFYGIPRSTNDADTVVWLQQSGRTVKELETTLSGAGYTARVTKGDVEDPISGVVSIEDIHANRMDLLLGIRGMPADASARARTTSVLGATLKIVSAEDLIGMKLFAGGVQDIEDVRGILQVSREVLDFDLMRNVALHYGRNVAQQLDKVLKDTLP